MTVYMLFFLIGLNIITSEGQIQNKAFMENKYGDFKRQLLKKYFNEITPHSFFENSGKINGKHRGILKIEKSSPIKKTGEQNSNHLVSSRVAPQAVKNEILMFPSFPLINENKKVLSSLFPFSNYNLDDKNRNPPYPDIRRFNPNSFLKETQETNDYLARAGAPFIIEGSEIGDAAYIIPDNTGRNFITLPPYESPRRTYKLTINEGRKARKEIRKDNGEFVSSFSDVDGTRRSDQGELIRKADGDQVLVLRGSYSFTTPEGLKFRVDYTADQFGYHATQVLL